MNRMKTLAGAVAVAAAAAVSLAAAPQPGFGGSHGSRHGRGSEMRIFQEPNLTEQQRTDIREMAKRHREANKALFDRARQAREELHDALEAGNGDAARVGELTLAAESAKKELMASREQLDEQIASVLNPDQRAKFEQLRAERKKQREQWQENRGERGRSRHESRR